MEELITIRIDTEMAGRLDALRIEHSINVSDFVRKAIAERLEKFKPLVPAHQK